MGSGIPAVTAWAALIDESSNATMTSTPLADERAGLLPDGVRLEVPEHQLDVLAVGPAQLCEAGL